MKTNQNPLGLLVGLTLAGAAFGVHVHGAVFDESVLGDFSNNQNAPTSFAFSGGLNQVIGNVNGSASDSQDWITFHVPAGFQLTAEVLGSYTSADAQGFTGFHTGITFPGSSFSAGSYEGYTHFGTGAQNNVSPPVNLVGQDLLPIMADPNQAPGSTGFTAPLGAGDYTFLFQQLGGSTGYEFDFTLTAVPEPTPLMLVPVACGLLLLRRRLLST